VCIGGTEGTDIQGVCVLGGLKVRIYRVGVYRGELKVRIYRVYVYRGNLKYESEPPLKSSPLTCYKQFGTDWIIVLMFVESQMVHI